jgi:GntR family transcriptional regulator, transcriptional repressor for pyruvate dehydrogenase complex
VAVTDEAIAKIKAMIVSGELAPGQRLPPEKELGDRLGLSRSSLREAVKSLELIRVLDVRRGDGTYVTSLEPHLLLEALSFVVDLHRDRTVLEIFEVRRVLEPHAAAATTLRITADELRELEEELAAVGSNPSVDDLVAHDLRFHGLVSAASGNDYLASLLAGLSSGTVRARVWRGITEGGAVERTLAEHRAILDALHGGDPELVRATATVHIGGIESWLRRATDEGAAGWPGDDADEDDG